MDGKGRKDDLDTILDVAKRGGGTTICAFYDGAIGPYISYIEKFRGEFEALISSEGASTAPTGASARLSETSPRIARAKPALEHA